MNSLKMDSGLHSLLPLRWLKTCWWNSNFGEEQRFLGQRKLEQLKPARRGRVGRSSSVYTGRVC
jgi:hypothetical protein